VGRGARSLPRAESSPSNVRSLAPCVTAALVWAASFKLAAIWVSEQPILSLLAGTSVTFVTSSILFGWVGVAAATVVQLVTLAVRQGLSGVYPWATTLSYAAAGALAWSAFRYLPGLRRDFHGIRTIAWFAAAAVAGGVISPIVISTVAGVGDLLGSVATWSRSTIVSVLVFAPPLVLFGRRFLGRALASIPDERYDPAPRRLTLIRSALPGEAERVVGAETREPAAARDVVLGLAAVAAITFGKVVFAGGYGAAGSWWNFLFVGVLWWQARALRLPGALIAAGAVAAGTLVGGVVSALRASGAPLAPVAELSSADSLAIYAQILGLWLLAVFLGVAGEREAHLLEEVMSLNARLARDLRRVVQALTGAVEVKDEYTSGHLQRVQAFARDVGLRLGLPARELELLEIASTLHDIGKIAVPESILNKPGPLDADELLVIQRHSEIGARMLETIDGLREAAPLVLHHQERWDGRRDGPFPGYPAGLAGEAIPLGARIIAVVDCFDAMTTDRPYRRALGKSAAREALLAERGRQFDPKVVDTFLQALEQQPWA
jgi:hypothetical protein